MLVISVVIYFILIIIGIRAIICNIVQTKMINFYYSDKSGWDTHRKSIFEVHPQLDAFNMVFKFWVWPISNFYPEYKRANREKSI